MSVNSILAFIARLSGLRTTGLGDSVADIDRAFVRRHHAFKLFLSTWHGFQECLSDMQYTLCCDHPFGSHRVNALCTRMATQVFQCIKHLKELDPAPSEALFERFKAVHALVQNAIAAPPEYCLVGPTVLPLGQVSPLTERATLVDPGTLRLEFLRQQLPDAVPQGFVITAAGCQHYFQSNDLQSEINRRVQAAGVLVPRHLHPLSNQLAALVEATPLPVELRTAVLEQVTRLRGLYQGADMQLLFRGRVWPPGASEDCGVTVWGPPLALDTADDAIEHAVLATLARKQRAQCLVYRRARGLTDTSTGMCLTCFAVPAGCWGGIAQSRAPLHPQSRNTHVYACDGLPQELEYSQHHADRVSVSRHAPHVVTKRHPQQPDAPVLDDDTALRTAALARAAEAAADCPQVLTWVCTPSGNVLMLMTRPMALPVNEEEMPPPDADRNGDILLRGGVTVCPGRVSGSAQVVRQWEDVRRFPPGSILVAPDDAYIWGALIDRCAGMVVEKGFQGSRLASLAREFGKPALFGMENATGMIQRGQTITLCADLRLVYAGRQKSLLPPKASGRDYMPGSPVYRMLQEASQHILPLTMMPDSIDFTAANCKTYHDIVNYCHERAVASMFNEGSDKHHAPKRVRQLRDQNVPKQFWLVNLSDAFARVPKGPFIDVEDVTSRPMRALWKGMTAYPWAGPPVNSKGLLSVLFEATANPNLDPVAQPAFFTEKNYFLVSRHYCSLHSRFGFHFVSVEARLSEHVSRNFIAFELRGGAADMERRILRVRFVADLLWEFGFEPEVRQDAVSATRKNLPIDDGERLLAVVGYLAIHTRQLDMVMRDTVQMATRGSEMLRRCRNLYQNAPIVGENA